MLNLQFIFQSSKARMCNDAENVPALKKGGIINDALPVNSEIAILSMTDWVFNYFTRKILFCWCFVTAGIQTPRNL